MMSEQSNAIKIAVVDTRVNGLEKHLQEQINGLREQQTAHNRSTQERFDRVEVKIDDLTAIMNKGKGAWAASMMAAGAIGAFMLKLGGALVAFFR